MDDLKKLEMLRRAKKFIQNSVDLSDDIKEKMLRVVDYVLENQNIQEQLFDKNRLFQDNANDKNPVSLLFTRKAIELNINYYDAKQYTIIIDQNGNYDQLKTYTSDSGFFRSPSKAREIFLAVSSIITLPQVEETVIDVQAEVVEENPFTPATEPTQPAPPPSTTEEPQPEQNADLEKLKKSLNALSSASETNAENELPAYTNSKETIRETVSALLKNDEQLAQLLDKSKLIIYKDEKSRQPVLLFYNKHNANVSAIVYNHSGEGYNYFFRKQRGTFIGKSMSVEAKKTFGPAASLEDVEQRRYYPKWVITTAEQQPETKPSTPKAEPTTTTETEAAPSHMEILKSNLENLSKFEKSLVGGQFETSLVAAVEYILKDAELLTKLANGKDLFVRQNPEDENPVLLSKPRSMYELSATVYYPTLQENRVVKVIYNSIDPSSPTVEQQIIAHDNTRSNDYKYLNSDEIIEKIPNIPNIEQVSINKGQQSEQSQESNPPATKVEAEPKTGAGAGTGTEKVPQQPSTSSIEEENGGQDDQQSEEPDSNIGGEPLSTPQPQATLKSNLEALLDKAKSSKEDHYKRLAAAIEFILSTPEAMQKLAAKKNILVVDHEGKNPVDFFWEVPLRLFDSTLPPSSSSLHSTVYYPRWFQNRRISVTENTIENEEQLSHNNDEIRWRYWDPKKIINRASTKFNLPDPKHSTPTQPIPTPPIQEADNDQIQPSQNPQSQTPATLKSNLEALLDEAKSSKEDHYKRLAAAIEFIQSNNEAKQKLAAKKNILVADHEEKNPVRFFWDGENLFSTVYYPKYNKNRFIAVCDNKIEDETKVFHSNKSLKALTPDKIIKEIESDNTFYRPEGQQSAQQQQTQSSQPVAQTRPNILDDNKKKNIAIGATIGVVAVAAVGIMKNQASNSPQVKSPPQPSQVLPPPMKTEVVPNSESKTPKPQDPSIKPGSRGSKLNQSVPYEGGGQVNRGASPPIQGDANNITFSDIFKSEEQKAHLQSIVRTRGSDGYNHLQANAEEIANGGNVGGAALKASKDLSVFNGGVNKGNLQTVADALTKGDTLNQQQQGMIDTTLKALQQANGVGETPTLNTPAKKIEAIQNLQKAIGEKTDGHYQQIIGQSEVRGISVDVGPGGTFVSHAPSGGGGFADNALQVFAEVGNVCGCVGFAAGVASLASGHMKSNTQKFSVLARTVASSFSVARMASHVLPSLVQTTAHVAQLSPWLGAAAFAMDFMHYSNEEICTETLKNKNVKLGAVKLAKIAVEENNTFKNQANLALMRVQYVGAAVTAHKSKLYTELRKDPVAVATEAYQMSARGVQKGFKQTQKALNQAKMAIETTKDAVATKARTTGAKVAQYCETSKQTLEATCAKVRDNVMALLTFGRGARQALASCE